MNEIQDIIKGKPSEFSRKTGCPKVTARRYSCGISKPASWIVKLAKWALNRGYGDEWKR